MKLPGITAASTAAALAFTVLAPVPAQAAPKPVIQLLALNDLHGNLDAVPGAAGQVVTTDDAGQPANVQAGGLARMATLLKRAREGQNRSLTVAAGDMIGGSPLVSAAYHDEPAVDVLGEMGLAVSSVGNHEFDEGRDELQRMVRGGCHPVDGCAVDGEEYAGTPFPYLAANVVDTASGEPILPPYWIKDYDGVEVGFIGLVTRDVPSVVVQSGIAGLEFRDEVATIDRYAKELSRKGVKAIVTLIHEGGEKTSPAYDFDCDAQGPGTGVVGPIKAIAERASSAVDLIVTGHSHEAYVCSIPDPKGKPRLITQAASFGRTFTDIRFQINPDTGDVVRKSVTAANRIVALDTPEDPAIKSLVDTWHARSAEIADAPVGYISGDIPGRGSKDPEKPLGDLISDTQAEATGAQIAFLNPGGMRADLVYEAGGREGDGVVTYGESFQVQPFGNILVTMDLTGAQVLQVLREQYSGANAEFPRLLQLSGSLEYSVDESRKDSERILAETVRIDGAALDPSAVYRVAANTFLADGGNDFPTFKEGTDRVNNGVDLDAFVSYLKAHSSAKKPFAPPKADRVTFLGQPQRLL
ncbi:bifunctional metallophosphatase/5'-nucleotidase [Phytomonospora endophytica]|uniref:5'-nucleotidase n=1 Tax=Phytomonospora endophytica TaxID=714109 RepID=A0A841FFM0_9ACTN|nr:bifunctional metallophosphatase/5'-nucleotidase [Phytomonospora endophytica]MBB6036121.1 5'-nucleotidase [Phytomonospora endophytica]GIG67024.1 5'-nucleotidase [Phytomonospora endophytica]